MWRLGVVGGSMVIGIVTGTDITVRESMAFRRTIAPAQATGGLRWIVLIGVAGPVEADAERLRRMRIPQVALSIGMAHHALEHLLIVQLPLLHNCDQVCLALSALAEPT